MASVCRVVRIANGLADLAAGGGLVAVGCGPLADLAQFLACLRTVTGAGLSCGPPLLRSDAERCFVDNPHSRNRIG